MYKILVIGDIHGHNSWKSICEKEKDADKVVFLGDYFDSFHIPSEDQKDNFLNILEFKHNHPNCILLLGNHDYHYIYNTSYSGYSYITKSLAQPLITKAIQDGDLNIIHIHDNIVFSHAGISEFWLNKVAQLTDIHDITFDKIKLSVLDWNGLYGCNPYGDTISNSPIWIRPKSLNDNKVRDYVQVVGHTPSKKIVSHNDIWICDTLPNEYLTIIDNEFKINDNR